MANGSGTGDPSVLFGQRDPVFRPWPLPDREPANIAEFVRRVKAQGGEFRKLTEEGLREEIARRKREGGEEEEEEEEEDNDDDDDEEEESGLPVRGRGENGTAAAAAIASTSGPKSLEEMIATRDDVLRSLESALQNGLIVVDFVSLLLSKDRPTQALQTLSPLLREKIGIGTLSAGRVANAAQAARALQTKNVGGFGHGSHGHGGGGGERQLDETTRFNAQRVLDGKIECVGWQLLAMDRAAAMLTGGRKRLQAEMHREERYWSEVVAVRDRGWGLSRTPGQRRVLRVKFGFSEAAADLRAAGFGPLRRVKHGHIALDMSALGAPSAVVVTLRRSSSNNNNTSHQQVGRSSRAARLPAAAPLEDRILEARNTIFAKELWRELNREARLMAAHGLVVRDSEIVFPAGAHTEGVIALVPLQLDSRNNDGAGDDNHDNHDDALRDLAETISSSLHLFLAHGHRQHYRQRSVPGPPSDSTGTPPPAYFVLRPILANIKYEKAISHLARFLSDVCSILHAAGQTAARFALYERPLSAAFPADSQQQLPSSEVLAMGFLAPREFTFELTMAADTRLSIRSRTTVVPLKTQYLIQLLPPPSVAGDSNIKNALQDVFPPADNYATLRDLVDYVGDAVAHVLAAQARSLARASVADGTDKADKADEADKTDKTDATGVTWATSVDGQAVYQQNDPAWEIRFSMRPRGSPAEELEGRQEEERPGRESKVADVDAMADGDDGGGGDNGQEDKDGDAIRNVDSPLEPPAAPELRLYASWPTAQAGSSLQRTWTWTAGSAAGATLQDLVRGCISGTLRPGEESRG